MPHPCDSVNHFAKIVTTIAGKSPQVFTCILFADVFRLSFDFFCFVTQLSASQRAYVLCSVDADKLEMRSL